MTFTFRALWRPVLCEFFSTFLLLFLGLASVLPSQVNPYIDNLLVPGLCFFSLIISLILLFGPTSGCHMNPAVTLGFCLVGRLHPITGFLYFIAQILGAIGGSGFLYVMSPKKWVLHSSLAMTKVHPDLSAYQAVGWEVMITMLLLLMVLLITDPHPNKDYEGGFPALSVSLTVLACIYGAAPYTGASLNPARSLGPAVIMNDYTHQWVYWAGPLAGAVVAVGVYRTILVQGIRKEEPEDSKPAEPVTKDVQLENGKCQKTDDETET